MLFRSRHSQPSTSHAKTSPKAQGLEIAGTLARSGPARGGPDGWGACPTGAVGEPTRLTCLSGFGSEPGMRRHRHASSPDMSVMTRGSARPGWCEAYGPRRVGPFPSRARRKDARKARPGEKLRAPWPCPCNARQRIHRRPTTAFFSGDRHDCSTSHPLAGDVPFVVGCHWPARSGCLRRRSSNRDWRWSCPC